MANVIVIKKGAGVPAPDQLQEAELALDVTDGSLYSKLQDGNIHHLNDGADDVDLSDYVLEAPDDGVLYGRQSKGWVEVVIPDGGTGSSVHIGENPPVDPQEGQQWMEVPASGDATMWIYDGAVWLQQPSTGGGSSGGGPSADMTGYATEAYVGEAIAAIPATDLSDYYTSTEADNAFQPKGNYIADAPSDGNLYIRKDGGWEVYVPSSGGGSYMKPVEQPVLVGEWTYDMRGNVGSQMLPEGSWYLAKNAEKVRLTVPAGFKFVVTNMTAASSSIRLDKFKIDGVQIWKSGSPMGDKYKQADYDSWFFANPQNFIAEDYVEFGANGTSDTWWHLMGWFIAADGTRESEILREEYLVEEAERIAAMPPPEPESDEVGTQEIPDE